MKTFSLGVMALLLALAGVAWGKPPTTRPAAKSAATPLTTRPATTQPTLDKDAAAKLILQLGDADFAVREAATQKLIALGDAVRPMLVEKAKEQSLDPEVADRIQKVIADLDRQHWPIIKGKVVDQKGKPVANAKVFDPDGAAGGEVRTKADGTFVFRLPPGSKCRFLVADVGDAGVYMDVPSMQKADETRDLGVVKLAPGDLTR